MLDFSRCRLVPFAHQREDTEAMVRLPYIFIASEPRTGKTKICVDAAQFLFEANAIDTVVVVSPAPVRDVWYDHVLGEIHKHRWLGTPTTVVEFHARVRKWEAGPVTPKRLTIYVSNFEFLRSKNRLTQLLAACGPRTLLIGDESSFLKNHAAQQTKAFLEMRRACGRVALLNGTPIFHSPMDLFSQGNILHPSILDCKYVTHFKARYAVQAPVMKFGGKPMLNKWNKPILTVEKWVNLDDLQRRFAHCTVRRLQKDCLDMVPEKLEPVTLTAVMEPATWAAYKQMRDEMVVWLKSGDVAVSRTAAIKALRLSQITGGFLGGVEHSGIKDLHEQALSMGISISGDRLDVLHKPPVAVQELGREKLDVLLWFIERELERDPHPKVVAWGRFRAEVLRAAAAVKERFPQFEVATIMGGQTNADRIRALGLLKPETSPDAPVFVCGIEGTGSYGLDFSASHTCVTLSSGYSPGKSKQTLDRVYGTLQTHAIAYYDVVATGPRGQKTIDHDVLAARRAGEDVATRTAEAWVKALTEE